MNNCKSFFEKILHWFVIFLWLLSTNSFKNITNPSSQYKLMLLKLHLLLIIMTARIVPLVRNFGTVVDCHSYVKSILRHCSFMSNVGNICRCFFFSPIPHINSETNPPPPIINVVCKYLRQFRDRSFGVATLPIYCNIE